MSGEQPPVILKEKAGKLIDRHCFGKYSEASMRVEGDLAWDNAILISWWSLLVEGE